jgi:hypothetical protein
MIPETAPAPEEILPGTPPPPPKTETLAELIINPDAPECEDESEVDTSKNVYVYV